MGATVRQLRRSSLQATILLLVTGTVAGLTLLMLASVLLVARNAGNQAAVREFRTTAAFVSEFLAERTKTTAQVCKVMASQPTFLAYLLQDKNRDALDDWRTVSDIADQVREGITADDVIITDRSGRAIGESRTQVANRVDLSREAGVAAALEGHTWQGVLSKPNGLIIQVGIPVRAPGGEFIAGTFYAATAFDDRLASRLKSALGCEVAFLSNGRVVAASLPLASLAMPTATNSSEPVVLPQAVRSGGESYLATYQQIEFAEQGQRVEVLLLHPYAEATALLRALQFGLIAPALVTLLMAIIAGAMLARGVTRPLDTVVSAARLLREGQWPTVMPVERGDEIGLLQAVFNDMSGSLRAAQERLLSLIDTDPLTGLDNHRRFQERLEQEVHRAADSGEPLALLVIDLDHFQAFNQKNGHARGDAALLRIAEQVRDLQPPFALSARYAGDALAVLLPRTTAPTAQEIAEQIRTVAANEPGKLTVSIGVATYGENTSEPESMTLAAELALAQAKQLGRNRVCSFDAVAGEIGEATGMPAAPYHLHRFLRDGSLATIQALAAAVDAKDPYTQGHSRRVANLAMLLALRVGLGKDEADLVYTAGTLHDVGKIGVPDRILQKGEALDNAERQLMETHPIMGAIIVGKVPQLSPTLAGVRHHHERWDGTGYPDRLAGNEIPLIARILALADTFDAMTSDRPYRNGLPVEITLQEMAKQAGKQFDPDLAAQFIALLREQMDQKCLDAPG